MSTLLPKIIQIGLMVKFVLLNMTDTNLATYDDLNLNVLKLNTI